MLFKPPAEISWGSGAGYWSYRAPGQRLPQVSPSLVRVFTVTEGLAPEEVEKQFQIKVDPRAFLRYYLALHDVIGRIRANSLNVGAQFIEQGGEQFTIRSTGLAEGVGAGQVFDGIRRFEIYLRDQEPYRDAPEEIEQLMVTTPSGQRIPPGDLAEIETIVGPRPITRKNAPRFITVQANAVDRDLGGFVREARAAVADQIVLPTGHLVTWGGPLTRSRGRARRP